MRNLAIALGSNLGDRRENIKRALNLLRGHPEILLLDVAPLVETKALLEPSAPESWSHDFLNTVLVGESSLEPLQILQILKDIESSMGREEVGRWAPRLIDLDLLYVEGVEVKSKRLQLPHAAMNERNFVLGPLKELKFLPNKKRIQFLSSYRNLEQTKLPCWVGILNVTPDSFSDGGEYLEESRILECLKRWRDENIGWVDLGGESTRPGAENVSLDEEWSRVSRALECFREIFPQREFLGPRLSLDSRRSEIVQKALPYGVDVVNDVSGADDEALIEMVASEKLNYVLMHNLGVPADPQKLLPVDCCVVSELKKYFHKKLNYLLKKGVAEERIILDVGLGFGKSAHQSLELLTKIEQFLGSHFRCLVGHSRKSFMRKFEKAPHVRDRDISTLAISLQLARKGVDYIRVHDPVLHQKAWRAWSHVEEG